MRRPRITIRRLMIVVAICGCLLGAGVTWMRLGRRSEEYSSLALQERLHEDYARMRLEREVDRLNELKGALASNKGGNQADPLADRIKVLESTVRSAKLEFDRKHARRRAYDRIALFPWLSAAPDPDEPR